MQSVKRRTPFRNSEHSEDFFEPSEMIRICMVAGRRPLSTGRRSVVAHLPAFTRIDPTSRRAARPSTAAAVILKTHDTPKRPRNRFRLSLVGQ